MRRNIAYKLRTLLHSWKHKTHIHIHNSLFFVYFSKKKTIIKFVRQGDINLRIDSIFCSVKFFDSVLMKLLK